MKDDLEKYVARRKRRDAKFAAGYESGYQEFKVGALLRVAREQAGITQEDLAPAHQDAEVRHLAAGKSRRGRSPLHH